MFKSRKALPKQVTQGVLLHTLNTHATHTHTQTPIHTHTNTHTTQRNMCTHTHTKKHTHKETHTQTHIQTHIQTHTHTHTHTHTCTKIHTYQNTHAQRTALVLLHICSCATRLSLLNNVPSQLTQSLICMQCHLWER